MNGFIELESPNFDPNHAFCSNIEDEITTFLPKKLSISFFLLLWPFYKYFNVAPLPEFLVKPQKPLIPKIDLNLP